MILKNEMEKTSVLPSTPMRVQNFPMRMTDKGEVTIPAAMRKKHGLTRRAEVELVDKPNGVLIVKAGAISPGKRAVAALLRGGKIKGTTAELLRLTRGGQ